MLKRIILTLLIPVSLFALYHTRTQASTSVVDYDLVYVRAPRYGDNTLSQWNDTFDSWTLDPGSELILWHHDTGTHEVIFPLQRHIDAGVVDSPTLGVGAVADPNISYDATQVVFTYFHDVTQTNYQRNDLSYAGSDIYILDLTNSRIKRLTNQEFTPNTGNGVTFSGNGSSSSGSNPRVGVFNSGPTWLPHPDGLSAGQGRIIFTSTRNNFQSSQHGPGHRASELFVMDNNGKNVERVAAFNLARALHPVVLTDGRVIFTSWENQGMRVTQQFPLWQMNPDGTGWMSISGPFEQSMGHHFHTQTSDGDVVTTVYYNLNNNGFGELVKYPTDNGGPTFWGVQGKPSGERAGIPFDPVGAFRLTPFTTKADYPSPILGDGSYAGKFTHPAGAPDNDLLTVWTPGPANHRNGVISPTYDGGIYIIPDSNVINHWNELIPVFANDPNYNEQWPRPVVPYSDIYGVDQPQPLAWHSNDGSSGLEANTPFALIGSSSLTARETDPKDGDPFNIPYSGNYNYRWLHQGTDTKLYGDDDIFALRVLALKPLTDLSYTHGLNPAFWSWGEERMRILGEIPLRRAEDPTDTSFLVKIPADTPFTFQALDEQGRSLFVAQTWHSLRAGEVRTDCQGCHAHSTPDTTPFENTLAGSADFDIPDLTQVTPLLNIDAGGTTNFVEVAQPFVDVEYFRDVQPIIEAKCATCHTENPSHGYTFDDVMNLNLDADDEDVWVPWTDWPGTYYRLAKDGGAQFGRAPMNQYAGWFAPQATRYMRPFQSSQSLLAWKVWGERLDGRLNGDRPTETVPGDPNTFPSGENTNDADIDYIGTEMPPPTSGIAALTYDEKLAFTRWIDLGAPMHFPDSPTNHALSYFADDLRPVLTVADVCNGLVSAVGLGAYDLESGLANGSLHLSFDIDIDGNPAGTNFAAGINVPSTGITSVPLPVAVDFSAENATMTVSIQDNAGHTTEWVRTCTLQVQTPTAIGLNGVHSPNQANTVLILGIGLFLLLGTFATVRKRQR